MGLKLEELRKRLLQPVPASPTSYPTLEPGRQVWSSSPVFSQQPPTENSQDARHRSASAPEENPSARQRKGYRLEDREMEGYAMLYRAYLARRDLPGPEPTFADFVEIRKTQARIEESTPESFLAFNGSPAEPDGKERRLS